MTDLTPRTPRQRPLIWDDFTLDFQEALLTLKPCQAYIVGGAVRDAYLHRPIKDIDIATPHGEAIPLARRITNHFNADIFVMDKQRDVARVFIPTPDGRKTIDVAGFRGQDLAQDLTDRDFTINAMACDLHGDLHQLIDPCNGEQDAFDKIIRRCHAQSLPDDPIRALRAIRQSVQLNMRIEPETLSDVRQTIAHLPRISPERIRDEIFNMLALSRPVATLRVAQKLGALGVILPNCIPDDDTETWRLAFLTMEKLHAVLTAISPQRTDNTVAVFDLGMLAMQFDRYRTPLRQHIAQTAANERPYWSVLLLGALLSYAPSEQVITSAINQLKLSTPEANTIRNMQKPQTTINDLLATENLTDLQAHRYWYPMRAYGVDALLLALARYLAHANVHLHQQTWLQYVDNAQRLLHVYYNQHDQLVEPAMLINGHELMQQLSLKKGRIVGTLLTLIREAQVTQQITTSEQALALARQYVQTREES